MIASDRTGGGIGDVPRSGGAVTSTTTATTTTTTTMIKEKDSGSDLSRLLQDFQTCMDLTPGRVRSSPTTGPGPEQIIVRCLGMFNSVIQQQDKTHDVIQVVVRCFEYIHSNEKGEEAENRDRGKVSEYEYGFIMKLIICGELQTATKCLYDWIFTKLMNKHSKNHSEELQGIARGEEEEEEEKVDLLKVMLTNVRLQFNLFNAGLSKDVTNMYILLIKLCISTDGGRHVSLIPNIITRDFIKWFDALGGDDANLYKLQKFNIVTKLLVAASNCVKAGGVAKLSMLPGALYFSRLTPLDQTHIKRHYETLLIKFSRKGKTDEEAKSVYVATASKFHNLVLLSLGPGASAADFSTIVSIYQNIKLKYQDTLNDDIDWSKYHSSSLTTERAITAIPLDVASIDQLMIELQNPIWQNISYVDKLIQLMQKSLQQLNNSTTTALLRALTISLNLILPNVQQFIAMNPTKHKKILIELLDTITKHIAAFCQSSFDPQLNLLLKPLASLYKRVDLLIRYRNLANICFTTGGKLLNDDFTECLNQWMNCVNYEYNIFNENPTLEVFEHFKQKIDRIANLLNEKGKYHESQIFLFKNFQCFMRLPKLNNNENYLQIEKRFANKLDISLRLLVRSIIGCKGLNLKRPHAEADNEEESANLDIMITCIVSSVLEKMKQFQIDGKTLIINDMIENVKKTLKDHGLFQYLCIRYYNTSAMDSFTHINYKEFSEKKLPLESCLRSIKELIICYNYLLYLVNRTFNQSILIKCIDLFKRWLQTKPNSILSNNEYLLDLEYGFVKLISNFLYHQQHAFVYLVELLEDYVVHRSALLSKDRVMQLDLLLLQTYCDLKFHKQVQEKLDTMQKITDGGDCHTDMRLQLLKLKYYQDTNKSDVSAALFEKILNSFNNDHRLQLSQAKSRFQAIEILQNLAQFSYLSANFKAYQKYDYLGAIIDIRRSVRLGKMILAKHFNKVTNVDMISLNCLKWSIASNLLRSLQFGVELNMNRGITKNCLYYIDELKSLVDSAAIAESAPILKCYAYYNIAEFYLYSHKFLKANELMIKSDAIYNELLLEDNILELKGLATHAFYFQMIGDDKNEKIYYDKVDLFAKHITSKKLTPVFIDLVSKNPLWLNKQLAEIVVKRLMKFDHSSMNNQLVESIHHVAKSGAKSQLRSDYISAKQNLVAAKSLLQSHPVFSGIEESVAVIPSTTSQVLSKTDQKQRVGSKAISHLLNCINLITNIFMSDDFCWLATFEIRDVGKILFSSISLKNSFSHINGSQEILDLYHKEDVCRSYTFKLERQLSLHTENTQQLIPDHFNTQTAPTTSAVNGFSELRHYLPSKWVIITIDICPFNGDLLITRFDHQLSDSHPFVLRLPLARAASRDVDESKLAFEEAMTQLKDIITRSNATTKMDRISQIKSKQDKLAWWNERKLLDNELEQLLEKVESEWIGGFKGIFNQTKINTSMMQDFKQKFNIVLNQYLPSRFNKKAKQSCKLDIHDTILSYFFLGLGSSNSNNSTDCLEDLIYFVLDLLLFHGEENVTDEIDIDHMYIDIEELLNTYHSGNFQQEFQNFEHTILVVDKNCCNFPWESIPSLKNVSVSRCPSLAMLTDWLKRADGDISGDVGGGFELQINNGFYIINPNNDLNRTELNFRETFMNAEQWDGVSGRKPTEREFAQALGTSDLLVYIGHGSGDQYIKSSTIKSMTKCAPSLLIGCSSGILHENGLLEPYGPVYNHLIAGSQMCLVNLWDVTDKDIDRFTLSMFEIWGLFRDSSSTTYHKKRTISQAICASREVCTLKYLNGAAPILYGIPFKLK